jgi:hypothetical protein
MFEPNCVIVLIAPEISIKSSVVRSFMVNKLKKNILLYLTHFGLSYDGMYYTAGRLIIPTKEPKKVVEALSTCFGIFNLYSAQKIKFASLNDLSLKVKEMIKGKLKGDSFAVRGKSFSKEFSSKDLEIELGGAVLDEFKEMKVKLKGPEIELFCLTQKNDAFVYFESFPSAGGMPVSVQGKSAIICNEKTNIKDLFLLGKSLMKCGSSVILVSDKEFNFDLTELNKYNGFIPIKTIPLDLAVSYSKKGGVRAFFSCAKTKKEAEFDSKLIWEKVFAPFLF